MGSHARSTSAMTPGAPPRLSARAAAPAPPRLTMDTMDLPSSSSSSSRSTTPTPAPFATPRLPSVPSVPNVPSVPTLASLASPSPAPSPRKERHRKSVSVSGVPDTPSRHRRMLSAVDEVDSGAVRPGGPHAALEDLRSLRSPGRCRMRALRDLECALAVACTGDAEDMAAYVSLQAHTPLLALLGRHTASLAKRASTSSLPAGDELARHLSPEIDTALGILQGLTLLSKACKAAVGERWTIEMFLDLLLLLRTQPPESSASPTVYAVLNLLFCVLVDSPDHARTFEDLQGLEAVTRVLRGTGVAKDVRMKCCEFLYFYLLPEGSTSMPDTYNLPGLPGSRSSSASSAGGRSFTPGESAGSDLTQSMLPSPSHSRVNSIDRTVRPRSPGRAPSGPSSWNDLTDLPFIPETPRKPAKPSLGFQTPSANRRTSGSSSVTVLTPVAQSPDERQRLDESDSASASGSGSASGSASRTSSGSSSGSGSVPKGPKLLFVKESTPGTPSRERERPPQAREVSTGLGLARRPSKRTGKSPLGQSTPDTPRRSHARSQSASVSSVSTASTASAPQTPRDRQRSRGFPSDLTRGALPPATPLTPARRIPSARTAGSGPVKAGAGGAGGSVRSVAEKKEMLGMWLGNVDQLVQGVEKVGFWAKE